MRVGTCPGQRLSSRDWIDAVKIGFDPAGAYAGDICSPWLSGQIRGITKVKVVP